VKQEEVAHQTKSDVTSSSFLSVAHQTKSDKKEEVAHQERRKKKSHIIRKKKSPIKRSLM